MENEKRIKNPLNPNLKKPKSVAYYLEDGTPVYKHKFKEVSVVNQRSKSDKIIFGISYLLLVIALNNSIIF